MTKTLKDINEIINGELCGDGGIEIYGVAPNIKEAQVGEITFVANPKYQSEIDKTKASAIILGKDTIWRGKPVICVENPYVAFVRVLELFTSHKQQPVYGINKTVILGHNVIFGEHISVQAHTVIGNNVEIGDNTIIGPMVYIGDDTHIGSDVLIYPRVTIREEVTIGNGVIIHSGAVIGSDGFGFAKVSDRHYKIPQIGTVIIEDDVEIGANTTIDRATMTNGATIIKRGTKIDNLVQIAHNVVIGEDCLITAQTGIAGSTEIQDRVTFAGQSGTAGHLTIGHDSIILARGGVTKDLPPHSYVSGFPAIPHSKDLRIQASIRKLPDVLSKLSEREKSPVINHTTNTTKLDKYSRKKGNRKLEILNIFGLLPTETSYSGIASKAIISVIVSIFIYLFGGVEILATIFMCFNIIELLTRTALEKPFNFRKPFGYFIGNIVYVLVTALVYALLKEVSEQLNSLEVLTKMNITLLALTWFSLACAGSTMRRLGKKLPFTPQFIVNLIDSAKETVDRWHKKQTYKRQSEEDEE